jgi:hypothetical protein
MVTDLSKYVILLEIVLQLQQKMMIL